MGAINCSYNCSVDEDTHQLLLPHEISKTQWINEDKHCKCMIASCTTSFSIMNRKHHCRFCGHVVCSFHSKYRIMSKRICEECVEQYIQTEYSLKRQITLNAEPNEDDPDIEFNEIKHDHSESYLHINYSLNKIKDEMNDFSDLLHSQIKQQYQLSQNDTIYEFNINDNELNQIFKYNANDNTLGRYSIFKAWGFWQVQLKFAKCSCLDDCDSLKKLLFVMNIYHKWNDSKKYQSSLNMFDIINSLQTYSMRNIFNDYMHLKKYHGADQLYNFLSNDSKKNWWFDMNGICYNIEYFCTRKCKNDMAINCCFVRKIFSNYNKCNDECLCYSINDKLMSSYVGSKYNNDLIKRNTYVGGCSKGKDFECIQLLDIIHCFLFHNVCGANMETESSIYMMK